MTAKPSRPALVPIAKPNLIDRAIGYFAPAKAVERLRARSGMQALYGSYTGGRLDRRESAGWYPFSGSADADITFDMRMLRARSRDALRNQPLALGAVNTVVTNVVGSGLVMRSQIDGEALGMTKVERIKWQNDTNRAFRAWCETPTNCDASSTHDFYGLQELAFRSALESGDVFATLPWIKRATSTFDLKINLIESDRCVNAQNAADTATMIKGVGIDAYGAPTSYSFLRYHPGGFYQGGAQIWDTVPAFGPKSGRRNVVHLFAKVRPGQTRGIPYLSPVLEALKQLSDYTTAEIQAAVVSSLFTVFVKTPDGEGLDTGFVENTPAQSPVPPGTPDPDNQGATASRAGSPVGLGNGAIVDLAAGEDVEFADPKRPNVAFDAFVMSCLRQIGVALELPFEVLIKHFTSSYSAARAALLEAWRFYKKRRVWLASMFCQPVYEAWLEEAVIKGKIDAPGFLDDPEARAAYCGTKWIGDSPGQIDPQKEVDAAKGRLELLMTTRSDECDAMTGSDWTSMIESRADEEELINSLGLSTTYAPLPPANVNTAQPPAGPGQPLPAGTPAPAAPPGAPAPAKPGKGKPAQLDPDADPNDDSDREDEP